jgi:hypothetical protein
MNGLIEVSASIDNDDYEFSLEPTVRNFNGEWRAISDFTGQSGAYEVTFKRDPILPAILDTITCYTDAIPPNLTPLPVPKNLRVSFKEDPTQPTLSFDSVDDPRVHFDFYVIRIYDKDYSRRIYDVKIPRYIDHVPQVPMVTFSNENRSSSGQTHEALVPGERYLFRADLWKNLMSSCSPSPSNPCPQNNLLLGTNFKSFEVPKTFKVPKKWEWEWK